MAIPEYRLCAAVMIRAFRAYYETLKQLKTCTEKNRKGLEEELKKEKSWLTNPANPFSVVLNIDSRLIEWILINRPENLENAFSKNGIHRETIKPS